MIALQTPHFTVLADGAGFVVRLQRSALDYPDIPSLERDMDAISSVLDRLGRERKGICIDWREGPMRNDAPFEEAIRRALPRLFRGYRAGTIVVRSAVGVLQAKRHVREASLSAEVFQDEADALDHLRTASGMMSRRPTPIPGVDRVSPLSMRGDRPITAQLQAIERVPPTVGTRSERHSSLPPIPSERPSSYGLGRDRISTVPPQAGERPSQIPSGDERSLNWPLPPPSKRTI